jgi:hypothetical protein
MFFREDMNLSIIDGCDDEAAGQDLRFSVRNKKETNRKKQDCPSYPNCPPEYYPDFPIMMP